MPIDAISAEELASIWEAQQMPDKRAAGILQEIIVHRAMARNAAWLGGESRIVKLLTPHGQHIGTVHEVILSGGEVVHSHPKDYTRRDCSRVRASGEPR